MPASIVLAPQSDVGTRSLHEMLWSPGEKWIVPRHGRSVRDLLESEIAGARAHHGGLAAGGTGDMVTIVLF